MAPSETELWTTERNIGTGTRVSNNKKKPSIYSSLLYFDTTAYAIDITMAECAWWGFIPIHKHSSCRVCEVITYPLSNRNGAVVEYNGAIVS